MRVEPFKHQCNLWITLDHLLHWEFDELDRSLHHPAEGFAELRHTQFITCNFECLAKKAGGLLKGECGEASDILCGNQLQTRLRMQGQDELILFLDRRA